MVYLYSTIKMMHGPINIRCIKLFLLLIFNSTRLFFKWAWRRFSDLSHGYNNRMNTTVVIRSFTKFRNTAEVCRLHDVSENKPRLIYLPPELRMIMPRGTEPSSETDSKFVTYQRWESELLRWVRSLLFWISATVRRSQKAFEE